MEAQQTAITSAGARQAALESASLNIFVNTQTLQDRSMAAHLDAQADTLLCEYLPRARRVADEVGHRLRKEG